MSRPHVVVVSDHASVTGGAEMVAITSAVALVEQGFEVSFVAGSEPRDPRLDQGFQRVEVLGAKGYRQSEKKSAALRDFVWNKAARKFVAGALEGLDPTRTVVHLHSYLNVLSPSALGAVLDAGFRCVITLHDYGIVCPNSGLYIHPKKVYCPLTPLSARCIFTQCSKSGALSKAALVVRSEILKHKVHAERRVEHFIAVSRRNGEIVRPFLPSSAQIHLVRNPYSTAQAPRVEAERNEPLLFVGRLTSEKDPVRLAEATRRVGVPVVFVGTGPLEAEVRAANPGATITGWLMQEEVAEWYSRGRANVMTSRWHEGSPLSLTDSAARGLPSVVPATMAGAENVLPGKTGFHFSLDSDAELDAALEKLMSNDEVHRLSLAAYEDFWASPPTPEAHVKALESVYISALS